MIFVKPLKPQKEPLSHALISDRTTRSHRSSSTQQTIKNGKDHIVGRIDRVLKSGGG